MLKFGLDWVFNEGQLLDWLKKYNFHKLYFIYRKEIIGE